MAFLDHHLKRYNILSRIDRALSKLPAPVSYLVRGAAAVAMIAFAALIRSTIVTITLPFLFFIPAIMAAGLGFGVFSGLTATITSSLVAVYFFIAPFHQFWVNSPAEAVSVGFYIVICSMIALVCAGLRQSLIERDHNIEVLNNTQLLLRQTNANLESNIACEVEKVRKAEDLLRHSQKMEAVGQLTGGIAHDFNNILTGIVGSLDLLSIRIGRGDMTHAVRYIEIAQISASRAAALIHRLLAFSRRQTLEPKATDVSSLVQGLGDMLQRTLGPDHYLIVLVPAESWIAFVDQSQLENAILNLCINSRDAMPNGGSIVLSVENITVDAAMSQRKELSVGDYLAIRVVDAGCGMDAELVEHIFEPFFTTKPLGSGTGLGLSMIYGFARQSGGTIRVESTPNAGTKMSLFLPRHQGVIMLENIVVNKSSDRKSILVVDDEPSIRMVLSEIIEDLGHDVIDASTGADGLKILLSSVPIDLLISDVGLPGGLNGRQMVDASRHARPDLAVLFITGYADISVLNGECMDTGMHILTKPFSMAAVTSKIKELLNL